MARLKTPRKRVGELEEKRFRRLLSAIRRFKLRPGDRERRETALNDRMIRSLQALDPLVVNRGIAVTGFVGETYRPECTLQATGRPYTLFALECKKLHDHSAKRLFKEGLSQALLYSGTAKIVVLALFDFTTSRSYCTAFGPGNQLPSRMAKRLREELRVHIVALRAP